MSDIAADTFWSADTFRENLTIDEETGAVANHTSAYNSINPPSNLPQAKSRIVSNGPLLEQPFLCCNLA